MRLIPSPEIWPELPLEAWNDTYATLHMWTQIVGKIRLNQSPKTNHWWNSALYVSARGLTTSPIPYNDRTFEIEFDFIDHTLHILTDEGLSRNIALAPRTVADFYFELMSVLSSLGLNVKIDLEPKEVPNPIRFDDDRIHNTYDPEFARRFWQILVQSDRIFKKFRAGFIGKCSPVHFFWGSFDLAVTRFSGRRAPERSGVDNITREAYSHEVISCGFWPGSGNVKGAAFYVYAAPEPAGFSDARIKPKEAFYNAATKGFVLMYDDLRKANDPEQMLLDFCESTYEAGATLGKWDRENLEMNFVRTSKSAYSRG